MFKLFVLSAVLAVAAAKPGYLHGGHEIYAAPVAIPAAVSHSSRIDVHSKPIAIVKSAPFVSYAPAVVAAPIAHASIGHAAIGHAPLAHSVVAPISYATSHASRYDIHHSVPVVSHYGGYGLGHGHGLGLAGHELGFGGHGYGGLDFAGHGLHGW